MKRLLFFAEGFTFFKGSSWLRLLDTQSLSKIMKEMLSAFLPFSPSLCPIFRLLNIHLHLRNSISKHNKHNSHSYAKGKTLSKGLLLPQHRETPSLTTEHVPAHLLNSSRGASFILIIPSGKKMKLGFCLNFTMWFVFIVVIVFAVISRMVFYSSILTSVDGLFFLSLLLLNMSYGS